jgi:hypothetical protein
MSRNRALIVAIRVALLIAGLRLLVTRDTDTGGSAAYHQGRMEARAVIGFLLVVAAIPFGRPRKQSEEASAAEDL